MLRPTLKKRPIYQTRRIVLRTPTYWLEVHGAPSNSAHQNQICLFLARTPKAVSIDDSIPDTEKKGNFDHNPKQNAILEKSLKSTQWRSPF